MWVNIEKVAELSGMKISKLYSKMYYYSNFMRTKKVGHITKYWYEDIENIKNLEFEKKDFRDSLIKFINSIFKKHRIQSTVLKSMKKNSTYWFNIKKTKNPSIFRAENVLKGIYDFEPTLVYTKIHELKDKYQEYVMIFLSDGISAENQIEENYKIKKEE
jgi:hypothetical protein